MVILSKIKVCKYQMEFGCWTILFPRISYYFVAFGYAKSLSDNIIKILTSSIRLEPFYDIDVLIVMYRRDQYIKVLRVF